MAFSYAGQVGEVCLVTMRHHPRVLLDDDELPFRVIAVVAEVVAAGEDTVTLSCLRLYPHSQDVEADAIEPDEAFELAIRNDAVLALQVSQDDA